MFESRLQTEAKKSRAALIGNSPILVFFLVFIVSGFLSAIPRYIYLYAKTMPNISKYMGELVNSEELYNELFTDVNNIVQSSGYYIVVLFSQIFVAVSCAVFCRVIEKRSLYSMGLGGKTSPLHYIFGAVVGLSMISLVFFLCKATGAMDYAGKGSRDLSLIFLLMLGFMVEGIAEEILFRGYFMISYSVRHSMAYSVVVSSLLFTLFNAGNGYITFFSCVNTFLFSVFVSLYFLKTENIWGASAIHFAWNFAQGNIFGLAGNGAVFSSFYTFKQNNAHITVNGGTAGPEGGLAVTFVLVLSIMILLLLSERKDKKNNGGN